MLSGTPSPWGETRTWTVMLPPQTAIQRVVCLECGSVSRSNVALQIDVEAGPNLGLASDPRSESSFNSLSCILYDEIHDRLRVSRRQGIMSCARLDDDGNLPA